MAPLSNAVYFLRNKRRVVPVLMIIALAIVGVSVVAVVGNSQFENYRISWEYPFRYFSLVGLTTRDSDPKLIDTIAQRDDVDRVIPTQLVQIRLPSLLGSITSSVFAIEPGQFSYFVEQSHLKIVKGRLPEAGKGEIALHEAVMKSRGLHVGDVIGRDVDDREVLRGSWTIVGEFSGPTHTGIVPLEVAQSYVSSGSVGSIDRSVGVSNYLVFPKPGMMPQIDAYIRSIPISQLNRYTEVSQGTILRNEFNSAKLVIWIIDAVTILVLSLATGLLNTIYFMQRMQEYGTLAAIGYKVRFLVRRTLSEAMTLTVFAWGVGLICAQLTTILLRAAVFTPRGFVLASINLESLIYTIPIPILIAIFSFTTVVRQFRRLDPVTIVEGRE